MTYRAETAVRALRASQARLNHAEDARIQAMRIRRHLLIGILAGFAFVILALGPLNLATYMAIPIALGLSLSELARAADIHFGWGYGHLYRLPNRIAWLDRVAARTITALTIRDPDEDAPEPSIRILPPG